MMLPCKPEHRAREVVLPRVSDQALQLHLLACQADDVTWAISYMDTGTPTRRAVALAALRDALWTNTMANTTASEPDQARRQDLRAAEVPGMTPHPDARVWWMRGQRPDGNGGHRPVELVAWHFSRGLKVFQATASAPTLRPDDPRLEAFEQGLTFPR